MYGAPRIEYRPSLLDAILKRKKQVQPIKAIEPAQLSNDRLLEEHVNISTDFQNLASKPNGNHDEVNRKQGLNSIEDSVLYKEESPSSESLSNAELKVWALRYFSSIPDQYKLPGDIKLLREVNALEDHFLPEELQKKLLWLWKLTKGSFLVK